MTLERYNIVLQVVDAERRGLLTTPEASLQFEGETSRLIRAANILLAIAPKSHRLEILGDFHESIATVVANGGGRWTVRLVCMAKCAVYTIAALRIRWSDLVRGKSSSSTAGTTPDRNP